MLLLVSLITGFCIGYFLNYKKPLINGDYSNYISQLINLSTKFMDIINHVINNNTSIQFPSNETNRALIIFYYLNQKTSFKVPITNISKNIKLKYMFITSDDKEIILDHTSIFRSDIQTIINPPRYSKDYGDGKLYLIINDVYKTEPDFEIDIEKIISEFYKLYGEPN